MTDADASLFDTKTKRSDTEAPYKHNALLKYMQRPENKDKRLRGGILIQDDFGNWVYSPYPLDLINGTADIDNWKVFDPQQYL